MDETLLDLGTDVTLDVLLDENTGSDELIDDGGSAIENPSAEEGDGDPTDVFVIDPIDWTTADEVGFSLIDPVTIDDGVPDDGATGEDGGVINLGPDGLVECPFGGEADGDVLIDDGGSVGGDPPADEGDGEPTDVFVIDPIDWVFVFDDGLGGIDDSVPDDGSGGDGVVDEVPIYIIDDGGMGDPPADGGDPAAIEEVHYALDLLGPPIICCGYPSDSLV